MMTTKTEHSMYSTHVHRNTVFIQKLVEKKLKEKNVTAFFGRKEICRRCSGIERDFASNKIMRFMY